MCLERIDELDAAIFVWARLRAEGALDDARAIDASPDGATRDLPLAGIPIGLKDIIGTAGLETSAGSRVLSGWVPDDDAVAVGMLQRHGAIVLGKTVTTEFASADPAPTRNPADLAHTPGGSGRAPRPRWPPTCAWVQWAPRRPDRSCVRPPTAGRGLQADVRRRQP